MPCIELNICNRKEGNSDIIAEGAENCSESSNDKNNSASLCGRRVTKVLAATALILAIVAAASVLIGAGSVIVGIGLLPTGIGIGLVVGGAAYVPVGLAATGILLAISLKLFSKFACSKEA